MYELWFLSQVVEPHRKYKVPTMDTLCSLFKNVISVKRNNCPSEIVLGDLLVRFSTQSIFSLPLEWPHSYTCIFTYFTVPKLNLVLFTRRSSHIKQWLFTTGVRTKSRIRWSLRAAKNPIAFTVYVLALQNWCFAR